MAFTSTNDVCIKGIYNVLPNNSFLVEDLAGSEFSKEEVKRLSSQIGTKKLFYASENVTAGDLALTAGKKLLSKMKFPSEKIDCLIFLTQTPDYITPATSNIIAKGLNLKDDCALYDVNKGCSAFIDGYFLASNLIKAGSAKNVLILIADTLRRNINKKDKGLLFIISDAASAVLVSKSSSKKNKTSILVKNSKEDSEALIIKAGGYRFPKSNKSKKLFGSKKDGFRTYEDLYMNGEAVFNFVLKNAPKIIDELLKKTKTKKDDLDLFLFHQANKFMIQFLATRLKIDKNKVPLVLEKYGNTNGSSIPFLISEILSKKMPAKKVLLSSFGIGLNINAAICSLDDIKMSKIEVLK